MNNAEEANAIAKEQYGSRRKHQAISQAVDKRLTYDLVRQKKVPAILCSNDAKACYDRVVHPILFMALRRLGVSKQYIYGMIDTYRNMEHHL